MKQQSSRFPTGLHSWTGPLRVFAGCTGGLTLFTLFWAWALRSGIEEAPPVYPDDAIVAAAEARATPFDPTDPLVFWRDVDYAAGPSARWFPKTESPLVRELVAEDRLPPLLERIGPEPVVHEGVDGIGRYGGTWNVLTPTSESVQQMQFYFSGGNLVRWSPWGYPIVPHVAREWSVSEDKREWIFFLRRGIRWSDGHPFTADDILYYWDYEIHNPHDPQPVPTAFTSGGVPGELEKIDAHTIRFRFEHPHALFLERLAQWWPSNNLVDTPKHYLMPYHPDFGDQAMIEEAMAAYKINTADSLYNRLKEYNNPDHPRMWPWVYRTWKATPPQYWVRNPYYFVVDTAGQQLPYVDRIMWEVKTPQMIAPAAAAGQITMQWGELGIDNYTLLMSQREKNHFRLLHWFPSARANFLMQPNNTRKYPPGDHAAALKAELLKEKRFRHALSYAINREPIIEFEYLGVTEPAQVAPGPETPRFYMPELRKAYTEYRPDLANEILDGIGLHRRDAEGFRTFADGTRLHLFMLVSGRRTGSDAYEAIERDWRAVGLRVSVRFRPGGLFDSETAADRHDIAVWSANGEYMPMIEPRFFVPVDMHSYYARAYANWYTNGGFYGNPEALERGTAPPEDHPLYEAIAAYEAALVEPDYHRQTELFKRTLEITREHLWTIAISTPPPQLVAVKEGFRNVPEVVVTTWDFQSPLNAGVETFYFENPTDSPGALARIKREIVTTSSAPAAREIAAGGGSSRLVSIGLPFLTYGIIGLFVVLFIVRHPYVGRRLVIMVPTLAVISVIVFTIIQIPPGDFISSMILRLEESGSQANEQEIENLKKMFHYEENILEQYSRWLGITWFVTYREQDKGLLQGNLGMSMATRQPVNNIVGDRIQLTFFIALGSVLFTWATALPIGVYSAVKQYSPGDYIVSFIGFIGMSVPGFLLALLLMYWSSKYLGINISGLYSPEYAAQPEWTWGKFVDLLQHIWLPIVVIGVSGTAGLIRVMRGNLLDELAKPYVVTARAKGVRPVKLLFKYPVRLALNPFISGIGGLFPYLISGAAIVDIVLSLPTVGPELLNALFAEDIYMAGSMLMVLSLLGVMGTLVSDLLLLILDPRIRLDAGNR